MTPQEVNADRDRTIRTFFKWGRYVPPEQLPGWLMSVAPECEQTRAELFDLLRADHANQSRQTLEEVEPRWKILANKYLESNSRPRFHGGSSLAPFGQRATQKFGIVLLLMQKLLIPNTKSISIFRLTFPEIFFLSFIG